MVYKVLNILIAIVWLINGLFCKVLNWVPRHQEIVSRVLNIENARFLTALIGVLEILMSIWVVSGIKSRICAITQVGVVLAMNLIEFYLATDLLLFGKLNLMFALFFCALILFNEFYLNKKVPKPS